MVPKILLKAGNRKNDLAASLQNHFNFTDQVALYIILHLVNIQ